MSPKRVFVSYCSKQGEWVWDRLVPCLKAGGAEILIDRERFKVGKSVIGQMDATQDKANRHLLVLSPDYLGSRYCVHEMNRAIALDPQFQKHIVLPALRETCTLPPKIAEPNPLYADLRDDKAAPQWAKLMAACGADLGTDATAWLAARDDIRRFLSREQSVNLVVKGNEIRWLELLEDISSRTDPDGSALELPLVDLSNPATFSRPGLVAEMIRALGGVPHVPPKHDDLSELATFLFSRPVSWLGFLHFDLVSGPDRRTEYGNDFYSALYNLSTARRRLVLLVESRSPFSTFLPPDYPLPRIELKTVELVQAQYVVYKLPAASAKSFAVCLFEAVKQAGVVTKLGLLQVAAQLRSVFGRRDLRAGRVRVALIAGRALCEPDLTRLPQILAGLPQGKKGFLAQTPRIREMVDEISRLQTRLNSIDRPVLREPTAQLLCAQINRFAGQVAGFRQPLASEFRAAAQQWFMVAQSQLDRARAVVNREPTPQVFRAGDPVDRTQEAFVPRNNVFGELERQIMLSTGCPGIVLYGRRRAGKSTVLRNMSGFIPTSVRIATISMQDPRAFTSVQSLIETISIAIRDAGVNAAADTELPHDLPGIFNLLSLCDSALKKNGERLLLAIDEYENIDEKIGEGILPLDLLATLRESIQKHRQVIWVLTGSHEIAELKHAPWNSYLVSARTVEVPPFSEAETRLLLTEPLKYSSMWDRDDPKRPRFSSSSWGDGGIERIHAEARGWPHLVQLIAETVVDLLNDTEQQQVDGGVLEQAFTKAVVRGDTVLRELMERECVYPGEWDYLRGFRTRDLQPPPEDEAIYRSLRRRLLVSEENGQWRLRVPLMQRWLRERA